MSQVFEEKPPRNCLLTLVVLVFTSCLCLSTITMSGLGGHQDEVRELRTEAAETLAADIATQYKLAVDDEAIGDYEFAVIRYEFILTEQPQGYLDVAQRLAEANIILSYTPTPSLTPTPEASATLVADTATPTTAPATTQPSVTSTTSTAPDVAKFFQNAKIYYTSGLFEEAIEYLDIVIALDPTYERAEVNRMLFESLRDQALIYFHGQNDGNNGYEGNQLARGTQLAERALEIQTANPQVGDDEGLGYELFFVYDYINAEAYVVGGAYSEAKVILEKLCALNCGWGYQGVTVQDLLDRANTGS